MCITYVHYIIRICAHMIKEREREREGKRGKNSYLQMYIGIKAIYSFIKTLYNFIISYDEGIYTD